jgi:hypothetical protein
MESRFSNEFGRVRVHTDTEAAESARKVNAQAYTLGEHIVFADSQYRSSNRDSYRLLAHELTHVLQQRSTSRDNGGDIRIGDARDPAEAEAETFSTRIAADSSSKSGHGACSPLAESHQPLDSAPLPPETINSQSEPLIQRQTRFNPNRPVFSSSLGPSYPGCSPEDSKKIDVEILMAQGYVVSAIGGLESEMASPVGAAGAITPTGSALDTHFHTHHSDDMQKIKDNLGRIYNMLKRGPDNWKCLDTAECRVYCRGKFPACAAVGGGEPVALCPGHLQESKMEGSLELIHEAAHQAGFPGDTYEFKLAYTKLKTEDALKNADSYAMFVRDSNPSFLRARARGTGWGPHLISISLMFNIPSIPGQFGYQGWDNRRVSPPSAQRHITNQFKGLLFFNIDTTGPLARPKPYTPPIIAAKMTLFPKSATSTTGGEKVMWEHQPEAATPKTPGEPLNPSWMKFDLTFSPSDTGTLSVEAALQDPDTKTAVGYQENFDVN